MSHNMPDPHKQAHLYGWKLERKLEEVRTRLWRAWARAPQTPEKPDDPFAWGRQKNHPHFQDWQRLTQLRKQWMGASAPIPEAVRREAQNNGRQADGRVHQMEAWLGHLMAPEPARRLMEEYPHPRIRQKVASSFPDPPEDMVEEMLDDPQVVCRFPYNDQLSDKAVQLVADWLTRELTRVHEGEKSPITRDTHLNKEMEDQLAYSLMKLIEEYGWPDSTHRQLLAIVQAGGDPDHSREEVAREVLKQRQTQLTIPQLMEALRQDPNNTWAAKALLGRSPELEKEHFVAIGQLCSSYSARRKLAQNEKGIQYRQVRQQLMDTSGKGVLLELLKAASGEEVAEIIERSLQKAPRKTLQTLEEESVDLSAVQRQQLAESLGQLEQELRIRLIRLLPDIEQTPQEPDQGRQR